MADENESQKVLDSIRQQKIASGLQPFKLVKYFSFSSLGVFLIFTLFLSWLISNHARTIMLAQSQDYSLLLAENLNQQVFRRFVIPALESAIRPYRTTAGKTARSRPPARDPARPAR